MQNAIYFVQSSTDECKYSALESENTCEVPTEVCTTGYECKGFWINNELLLSMRRYVYYL